MTDTLRTRIAAAIQSIRIQRDGDAAQMADAVIRELGLRRESMLDGISPVDDPPPWHHRYATEWKADE